MGGVGRGRRALDGAAQGRWSSPGRALLCPPLGYQPQKLQQELDAKAKYARAASAQEARWAATAVVAAGRVGPRCCCRAAGWGKAAVDWLHVNHWRFI